MNNHSCKYCGSPAIVKFGTYHGSQRYKCKECDRKYTTGKVFYSRVPADIIGTTLELYYNGERVIDIQQYLKKERNYRPSESTVYCWITRYTKIARELTRDNRPEVSDSWIFDENIIKINGKNVWLLDIADAATLYLLATTIVPRRSAGDIPTLLRKAFHIVGKNPISIIYCKTPEESVFAPDNNIQNRKYVTSLKNDNPFLIHRFDKTFTKRNRVRYFKNIETATAFNADWLTHYNYFQTCSSLNGATPAKAAGINYSYTTWVNFLNFLVYHRFR